MQKPSLDQSLAAIQALDLEPIKFKLCGEEDGYGWTREYADVMARDYKRYLTLLAKYPGITLSPHRDVDRFWHGHILDTLKYAEDCQAIFGEFLHHFPYLGLRGEEDKEALMAAAKFCKDLYEREFGAETEKSTAAAWCGAQAATAWCGAQVEVAWCGAKVETHAAWCGAKIDTAAAWCGAKVEAQPAWCGAATQASAPTQAAQNVAWCGAQVEAKPSGQVAWCGAATQAAPAWCGANIAQAKGQAAQANFTDRPRFAK